LDLPKCAVLSSGGRSFFKVKGEPIALQYVTVRLSLLVCLVSLCDRLTNQPQFRILPSTVSVS
ncbi:MAG TPA: hypothetical protein V6D34_08550, partial [Candidatus Sericytochromatia bacterium]